MAALTQASYENWTLVLQTTYKSYERLKSDLSKLEIDVISAPSFLISSFLVVFLLFICYIDYEETKERNLQNPNFSGSIKN